MKVCLVNVKYSPNLGDGLLTECLEKMLIDKGKGSLEVFSMDLAGRLDYQAGGGSRQIILKKIDRLPFTIRYLALNFILHVFSVLKWAPHYRKNMENADLIVIGGGNLISDVDWNFSTKLALVLKVAVARNLPVYIYGVGVSGTWTNRGLKLLRRQIAKSNIKAIYVRDQQSKMNMQEYFVESCSEPVEVDVVRDPGLFVSRLYASKMSEIGAGRIGICITSAIAVRHHSKVTVTDDELFCWYQNLYMGVVHAGYECLLFTNGSPEDVAFAEDIVRSSSINEGVTIIELTPKNPEVLSNIISTCDVVVAFRMHALIAAYSYGSSIFALDWDEKVGAFMQSVGMRDNLISVQNTKAEELISRITSMDKKCSKKESRNIVISEAEAGVDLLVNSISKI